jgi:hypothetical protein
VDLSVYGRVIWRFRYLILAGLFLAAALSVLSFARVSFAGGTPELKYRKADVWEAKSTLLITQAGFPWGRAIQGFLPGDPETGKPPVPVGDTSRLSSLASLYAQLASSDAVQAIMYSSGRVRGAMSAAPEVNLAPQGSGMPSTQLPMISIQGTALTAADAVATASQGTRAFLTFLQHRQAAAGIPQSDRVVMQVLRQPTSAVLVSNRKKTLPIVVFLSVMIAVLGLAFILENLRPRIRPLSTVDPVADIRRSA